MPRSKVLIVADYPAPAMAHDYLARVTDVQLDARTAGLSVTVTFLDRDQDGRTQRVALPLPVRPGNSAGAFFAACGFDIAVGAAVRPGQAVGCLVRMRFTPASVGQSEPRVSFHALPTEQNHGQPTT